MLCYDEDICWSKWMEAELLSNEEHLHVALDKELFFMFLADKHIHAWFKYQYV